MSVAPQCITSILKMDQAVLEGEGAEQLSHTDTANLLRGARCCSGDDNLVFKSMVDVLGDSQH